MRSLQGRVWAIGNLWAFTWTTPSRVWQFPACAYASMVRLINEETVSCGDPAAAGYSMVAMNARYELFRTLKASTGPTR